MRWTKDWGQRVRRIPGHVLPRRFRLYGVGNLRSGTTTLARMFSQYRAFHEWDAERFTQRASAQVLGTLSVADARAELRRRSRRFNIEADVAFFLSPFAGLLAEMYDDARFVLLVRDCFTWLESVVEWTNTRPHNVIGDISMAARYGRYGESFRPQEAALEAADLFPIAAYLRYWSELLETVMRAVPADRLLVVRTEDLDHSAERLAAFVGVDPSTIVTAHANRNEQHSGILRTVPDELVIALAQEHCAPLMQRFWGDDWVNLAARLDYR